MEENRKRGALSVNMTEGSLWKNMLLFSLPLMMTQVLEVLFNLSDVAIAGKFADYRALGAVGSTTLLVSLFTGLLIGMGSGVNVAVARGLGMGDRERVEKTVHTSFVLCAAFGIIVCLICILLAGPMLTMLHTKDELIDGATLYLKIYALSMPAMAIYNCGNGIMSAMGDTRRPLLYLSVAGVLNVILNLFFVIVCKMAADGVALASIISQYLSAVLVLLHMTRLTDSCRVEWKLLRLHGSEVGRILGLGVPAGIQHMIFAVANLFIQVGINSFDSTVVSGNSAAVNVDNVIYNVMAAFYTACSTFMGQNWGAGKKDRMMKSYYISLGYSFVIAAVLGAAFLLCGEPFLYIFTNDADVVAAGMERMRIMCFSYCVSAFMDCTIAACRGLGRSFVPTVIVIMGSCVFRVIWVYTIFAHFHTIPSLYLLYIFSWTITAAAEILYFIRCCRRLRTAQTA